MAETALPTSGSSGTGMGAVVSHGGPVRDHVSLVESLRGRGLTVNPASSFPPLLTAPGTILEISGGGIGGASIQSFDYPSAEAAAYDMARLTGSRTDVPMVSVMWMGPPHFFLRERAFVIYVGADSSVVDLLADLLGAELLRA